MSAELKSCPFCGGAAEFERIGNRRVSCIVVCSDCGARNESSDEGMASGEAWNRRALAAQAPQAPQAAEPVALVDQRNGTTVAWQRGSLAAALPHGTGLYLAPHAPAAQPLSPILWCGENEEMGDSPSTVVQLAEMNAGDRIVLEPWAQVGPAQEFEVVETTNGIEARPVGIAPSAQGEPKL